MRQAVDFVHLPGGRAFRVILNSDPARPWEVRPQGSYFIIVRAKRGDSGKVQMLPDGATRRPVVLDNEREAEELANALNQKARSLRPRGPSRVPRRDADTWSRLAPETATTP